MSYYHMHVRVLSHQSTSYHNPTYYYYYYYYYFYYYYYYYSMHHIIFFSLHINDGIISLDSTKSQTLSIR